MRKRSVILSISLLLAGTVCAQTKGQVDLSKVPVPKQHYLSEYTFDEPSDPKSWSQQKAGLHAAFGSTDELYLRREIPITGQEPATWREIGWRGERLNAQILVWSPDTIEQVRVQVSDLTTAGGQKISKDNVQVNMVRYVLSNFPYGATNFTCEVSNDSVWLMPDRFEAFERFDLPGGTVRPVWISVNVPREAKPGDYSGTVEIHSLKGQATLQLNLKVQNQVLPDPHDWKFRLDLWQNPWVVAWYYQVEPWSDEHQALLKKHLKLYADAGGKYITTYAVHSPWSDNSYMIEGAMIDWVKTANGQWEFDYSIFDQYVELAMESGIDKAITIYTPVPWGYRFRYLDEQSGNYIYEEWSPASAAFKSVWDVFLTDLKAHLTQKGWLDKTYLGINENPLDITLAAVKVIKEHSKDWKITYAGDWHPELTALLDDYSPIITSEPGPKELKERAAKGFTTTWYVCCTPPQPNNFVFSPPIEGRYIGWYTAAYGYDGFLRWAYDAWPADPMRDARHTLWPAGDCFLVYPGGNSCIRFEKLREGISDFEKIRILKEKAARSTNPDVKSLMKSLNTLFSAFTAERDYSKRNYDTKKMTEDLEKGKNLIRELSEELE
ncbi:MAG: glycoside hydrolase domain-containing protein [Mangrovibacterium sp.]